MGDHDSLHCHLSGRGDQREDLLPTHVPGRQHQVMGGNDLEAPKDGFLKAYNDYFKDHPVQKTTVLPMRFGHGLPDQALGPVRDIATMQKLLRMPPAVILITARGRAGR